eukprot:764321-Hanusia_phi.AAC.1
MVKPSSSCGPSHPTPSSYPPSCYFALTPSLPPFLVLPSFFLSSPSFPLLLLCLSSPTLTILAELAGAGLLLEAVGNVKTAGTELKKKARITFSCRLPQLPLGEEAPQGPAAKLVPMVCLRVCRGSSWRIWRSKENPLCSNA